MTDNSTKKQKTFSLDSFGVLLTNAYFNILGTDSSLELLQEHLTAPDTMLGEDMSTGKLIELYRAITNRQRNNIQLLTQLISISNRNEQIKLLLAELTKIKEIKETGDNIPKLSPNAQAALLGLRKLMLETVDAPEESKDKQ